MNKADSIYAGPVFLAVGEVLKVPGVGELTVERTDALGTWRFRRTGVQLWSAIRPVGIAPSLAWITLPGTPFQVRWSVVATRRYAARLRPAVVSES